MLSITFNGASRTVTGSCYLLSINSKNILIDCGMFQGPKVESLNKSFNFNPGDISHVFLTHAHIDHSGMIPKLFREGFAGKVFSTHESHDLTEILLYDSAKIQENKQKYRKYKDRGESGAMGGKLYDSVDVDAYVQSMETVDFDEWEEVDGIKFKYIRAGHILGAASILFEVDGKKIIFSGDLGRKEQSLILPYEYIDEEVDYIVMESLYGGQYHDKREHSINNLSKIIEKTVKRDGSVMIPSFSVHRSQELVAYLYKLLEQNQISQDVQIILDGPLTISATEIYTRYLKSYTERNVDDLPYVYPGHEIESIFNMNNLLVVHDSYVSRRASRKRKAIFIAGNGMVEGGRILGHLFKGIRKDKNSVVFVGYQAEDTLGRKILEGADYVKINGKNLKVKAEIHDLKGFSAHADQSDLLDWFENKKNSRLKKVFLTHADFDRSQAFKEILDKQDEQFDVEIPNLHDSFEL